VLAFFFAAFAADPLLDNPNAALPASAPIFVWPLSGTASPDWIAAGFTPRWKESEDRYDFHQAIDVVPRVTSGGTSTYESQSDILASPPVVHAVADGVVSALYPVGSPGFTDSGNVVRLTHYISGRSTRESNVYYTYYMHLADFCPTRSTCLTVGQSVRAGQAIAHLGNTSTTTTNLDFAHLHFEVRGYAYQFYAENPLRYLPRTESDGYAPEVVLSDDLPGSCQATFDPRAPVFAIHYRSNHDEIDVNQIRVTVTNLGTGATETHTVDYERRDQIGEYADTNGDQYIKTGEYDPDALPGYAEPIFDACSTEPIDVFHTSSTELTMDMLFTGFAGSSSGVRIEAQVCDIDGTCESATPVEAR
jgi:hypothetical protein